MRKRLAFGALLSGTLLVGGAVGAQDLTTADDNPHHDAHKTIWLYSVTEEGDVEVDIDNGDEGFGPGDRFIWTETLYRVDRHGQPTGDAIGRFYSDCTTFTLTDPDPAAEGEEGEDATQQCIGTMSLPAGDIYLQAQIAFSDFADGSITAGVTGGDGKYEGTTGGVTLYERQLESGETASVWEVRLHDGHHDQK